MKLKWAWILGFVGLAGSSLLVFKEHLSLKYSGGIDWVIPAFRYFNYPGFLAAPWLVDHFPFISHGDIGPNITEVWLCDVLYILLSGVEWFAIATLVIVLARKFQEQ